MAVIPPFWVPRPADNYREWNGSPISSQGLIDGVSTQQKVYGQPGQVLPFRPNFTYDDPSYWVGEPESSAIIPLLSHQQIYGQGGQVPPFRPNFTYDDPAFWLGHPTNAYTLEQLDYKPTAAQFRPNFTYDDPAFWPGSPVKSGSIAAQITPQPPTPRYDHTYDDSAFWRSSPTSSQGIIDLATTQQKFYGAPGQVPTFRPNLTFDDASPWIAWFNKNQNTVSTAAANVSGQPSFYVPRGEEPTTWQWSYKLYQGALPVTPVNTPFLQNWWRYNYDDPAIWVGAPVNDRSIYLPNEFPSSEFWVPDGDQSGPEWQWRPYNINLIGPTVANNITGTPVFYVPSYYDPGVWYQQTILNTEISKAGSNIMPPAEFWVPDGDQSGPEYYWWQLRNQVSSFPWPTPVGKSDQGYFFFTLDDPPVWPAGPFSPNYELTTPPPPPAPPEEIIIGRWGPDETKEERRRRHAAGIFFQWEEMPARSDFAPDPVAHPPHEPQKTADEPAYVRSREEIEFLAAALDDPLDDPEILELTEMYVKYMQAYFKK